MSQLYFVTPPKQKRKKVEDTFKAFLIEGAHFMDGEEYPIIEEWMVPDEVSEDIKIIPFGRIKEVKHIEDYYICFFCRDKDFNCVRNNPRKYLNLFRRAKGIIGFDFSVYCDMKKVKQKSQMNDNLSYTFFYGFRYVKVIPNVRPGNDETVENYLKAFPRNSIIAIGSYGCVDTMKEKERFIHFLDTILPELKPRIIVVYGAMPEDVFGGYINEYRFIQVDPYISTVGGK